jgi:hypothetical protein
MTFEHAHGNGACYDVLRFLNGRNSHRKNGVSNTIPQVITETTRKNR